MKLRKIGKSKELYYSSCGKIFCIVLFGELNRKFPNFAPLIILSLSSGYVLRLLLYNKKDKIKKSIEKNSILRENDKMIKWNCDLQNITLYSLLK